jgi:sodium-dependent dicarboxylate transporter 2/3/5
MANINPALLILPSCMAVSLSFMLPISKFHLVNRIQFDLLLPIATPPNAMIHATENMKTRDLIKAGSGAKLIGILVIFFVSLVLLPSIFHIHSIVPNSNRPLSI